MSPHLIIFTRYPEPHRTKTRLIPRLGPAGAAELQGDMTDHTLAWARELAVKASVSVQVRFEGGDEARMRDRFGDSFPYLPQGPGDLGERMMRAIAEAFAAGADRVIVVGTDCPGITWALTEQAFDRLASADLVVGPATDGGYYLIGLRRPIPKLFTGIAWGKETVLRETQERAEQLGLAVCLLTTLSDVDRPEDLTVWPAHFDEHVRGLLVRPGVVAGAFRLRINGPRRAFRFIEWAVNLRSRCFQMPYGDQAIFLHTDTFQRLGGFPELPIMEDFEFIRRLRRNGRVAIASVSATTSPRRWNQLGPWKTTWINQRIILGYHLGISPDTLAKWYSGDRLGSAKK